MLIFIGLTMGYYHATRQAGHSKLFSIINGIKLAKRTARESGERECQPEIKFWCDSCEKHRPIEVEPLRKDNLNGNAAWGDILCKECRFVIATVTTRVEGVLKLVLENGEQE